MQPKFLILVVDDDLLLLDILNRASRDSFPEASFVQVYSNTEAITYIHELDNYGPKLVLLDMDLGSNKSGLDFVSFLKVHKEGQFLPVIMLTINELQIEITDTYSLGVSSFTVKPFSFEDWKIYFTTIRLYWFTTVTIPSIRFRKLDYWK